MFTKLCQGPDGLGRCYADSPKASSAISTMPRLMDNEAVAPGEGAFRTWIAFSVRLMRKSSTRKPLRYTAWARTPAPPSARWCFWISGTSRCRDLVNAVLLKER